MFVKWLGKPTEEVTWISATDFRAQFPQCSLMAKAASEGEGNVTSTTRGQPLRVYTKRANAGGGG